MTETNSTIIVGAGHNGLACAAYLARAGRSVTVLEANGRVGGAAATVEFATGYRVSACAQFLYQLQPEIVRELALERHGLKLCASNMATIALVEGGRHLKIRGAEISGGVSDRDALRMREFHRITHRFAGLLRRLNNQRAPRLVHGDRDDRLALARFGLSLRRLGRDDMRDFLRVAAINIHDFLNEYFDSDPLKGALALDAVLGTHLGARSPNSVLTYLHRRCGAQAGVAGAVAQPTNGMGGVSEAFLAAATEAGASIRLNAPVRRIVVAEGRASGVELASGETLVADLIVSNADPRTTVMDLVGARHFETGFVRRIANIRMRGNASRLHLALDGLPQFDGLAEQDHGSRLLIAPDPDYVERAFNPAKYGECSTEPVIEMSIPTINDASLAPAGKHILSATVQYTPYHLKGGWDDDARARCIDLALARIARYAPRIREQVTATEFLSPRDIHARFGIYGGHWHHGELALDQFLFVRPVIGASQYELPLDGLYLCGAGAHPGGGVAGWAGRNAAKTILKKANAA